MIHQQWQSDQENSSGKPERIIYHQSWVFKLLLVYHAFHVYGLIYISWVCPNILLHWLSNQYLNLNNVESTPVKYIQIAVTKQAGNVQDFHDIYIFSKNCNNKCKVQTRVIFDLRIRYSSVKFLTSKGHRVKCSKQTQL